MGTRSGMLVIVGVLIVADVRPAGADDGGLPTQTDNSHLPLVDPTGRLGWALDDASGGTYGLDASIPPPLEQRPPAVVLVGGERLESARIGFGGAITRPGYDATGYFARPLVGRPGELALVRQNLSLIAPVWREGPDTLLVNLRVRNVNVGTPAILSDTGQRFPENLWNVNVGVAGLHRFDNGWVGGLAGTIGTASDRPFHGIDEMAFQAVGLLKVPAHRDADWWTFMLVYSSYGQLSFPIPLIRYDWNPSDRLAVGLGLPLSLRWRPSDVWRIDLSYIPLVTVDAKVTWTPARRLYVYGGFEWDSEGYFLADRRERSDRFFYQEKRLIGGFRIGVGRQGGLDVFGGCAFDRSFGAGRSPLDYRYDTLDVEPGPFLGARFSLRF